MYKQGRCITRCYRVFVYFCEQGCKYLHRSCLQFDSETGGLSLCNMFRNAVTAIHRINFICPQTQTACEAKTTNSLVICRRCLLFAAHLWSGSHAAPICWTSETERPWISRGTWSWAWPKERTRTVLKLTDGLGLTDADIEGSEGIDWNGSEQQEPDKNYGDASLLSGDSEGEGKVFVSPDFKL